LASVRTSEKVLTERRAMNLESDTRRRKMTIFILVRILPDYERSTGQRDGQLQNWPIETEMDYMCVRWKEA
jgi:hypothetical protein